MLVLCYGIQKSGSTLAFELVKGVLESAGYEQPFLRNERFAPDEPPPPSARSFIGAVSEEKILGLIEEVGPGRRIAVKTHSGFPDAMFPLLEALQSRRALQVVASYRDPRDICLSLLDTARRNRQLGKGAFRDLEDIAGAMAFVKHCIVRFTKWASLRGTLRLGYDTVAFEPERAIGLMETSLEVTADRERAISHAFESASTLKNRGLPNRHAEEMTPQEIAQTTKAFERFLKFACERDDPDWYERHRAAILGRIGIAAAG